MNKEDNVNLFLNNFFNFHHKINSLLFDNWGGYANLYFLLTELMNEFSEYDDMNFNEIARVSF